MEPFVLDDLLSDLACDDWTVYWPQVRQMTAGERGVLVWAYVRAN
jgi:hypothetical protein